MKAWRKRGGIGVPTVAAGELTLTYELAIDTMHFVWTDEVFLPEPDHWELEVAVDGGPWVLIDSPPGASNSVDVGEWSITFGPGSWQGRIRGIPAVGDPGPWVVSNTVLV